MDNFNYDFDYNRDNYLVMEDLINEYLSTKTKKEIKVIRNFVDYHSFHYTSGDRGKDMKKYDPMMRNMFEHNQMYRGERVLSQAESEIETQFVTDFKMIKENLNSIGIYPYYLSLLRIIGICLMDEEYQ